MQRACVTGSREDVPVIRYGGDITRWGRRAWPACERRKTKHKSLIGPNKSVRPAKVDLDLCRLSRQIRSAADEGRLEGADLGTANAAPAHQGQVSPDRQMFTTEPAAFPLSPAPRLSFSEIYKYIYLFFFFFLRGPLKRALPVIMHNSVHQGALM